MNLSNPQREHAEAHYGEDHDEGPGLLASPVFWFAGVLCIAVFSFIGRVLA